MIGWTLASVLAGAVYAAPGQSYFNASEDYQNGNLGPSPHQSFVSSDSKP